MIPEDVERELENDPRLKSMYEDLREALRAAGDVLALDKVRVAFLGRKGRITAMLQGLRELPPEERRRLGRLGNALKGALEEELERRRDSLLAQELERSLHEEVFDVTLPGRHIPYGTRHLLSRIIEEIEAGYRAVRRHGYVVEPDRRAAIRRALEEARSGDMVVIAGKGHETYQIVGQNRMPFDDREVAAAILKELLGGCRAEHGNR
mgnify:CR=1 FL=1